MDKAQLLPQILQLPPEDRLELLEDIRYSLDPDSALTAAQFEDLEGRIKDLEENPNTGDTWENVVARLRARA